MNTWVIICRPHSCMSHECRCVCSVWRWHDSTVGSRNLFEANSSLSIANDAPIEGVKSSIIESKRHRTHGREIVVVDSIFNDESAPCGLFIVSVSYGREKRTKSELWVERNRRYSRYTARQRFRKLFAMKSWMVMSLDAPQSLDRGCVALTARFLFAIRN